MYICNHEGVGLNNQQTLGKSEEKVINIILCLGPNKHVTSHFNHVVTYTLQQHLMR